MASAAGFFLACLFGGAFGLVLATRPVRTRWLVLASIGGHAVFWPAVMGMPFVGWAGEAVVIVTAAAVVVGPTALFFRFGRQVSAGSESRAGTALADAGLAQPRSQKSGPSRALLFALVFCVPGVPAPLFTLTARLSYAACLGWRCDGYIGQHMRAKDNHNAPTLVVGAQRFEQVDEGLWSRARIGQRLTKKQGTPWAMLDHERVRMVPLRMHWWSDPE